MIISYATLVYSFIADLTIFKVSFSEKKLIGALIMVAFNIWAVIDKFMNEEEE